MTNYDSSYVFKIKSKIQIWTHNRLKTISELRDIADYIDQVNKDVGIAKVE